MHAGEITSEVRGCAAAQLDHRLLEFGFEDIDGMLGACLTERGNAIHESPAGKHHLGAVGQEPADIDTRLNTAIYDDIGTRCRGFGQRTGD